MERDPRPTDRRECDPDQRVTLYSSLYRVHLWSEHRIRAHPGGWRSRRRSRTADVDDSPTMTGRRIVDGLLTVTDGWGFLSGQLAAAR